MREGFAGPFGDRIVIDTGQAPAPDQAAPLSGLTDPHSIQLLNGLVRHGAPRTAVVFSDAENTLWHIESVRGLAQFFSGNVVVTRGPTVMHATKMKLYSDLSSKDPNKTASKDPMASNFTRIEAFGPVTVNSADQSVTGANAVVDMKAQIMTLTGNVVLTRGTDVATGDRLVVDLRTGRAKIDQAPGKPIRVIISPETASAMQPGGDTKGKAPPTQ